MLMNIFSNFDPMWFNLYYKNSAMMIIPLLLMMNMFWLAPNKLLLMYNQMMFFILTELMKTKMKYLKGMQMIMGSLLTFVLYMNMLGMVPYSFSITSHITLTLSLAMPMWMLLIISSIIYNQKKTIGHLLPDSAPTLLNPFLVLIESVSIMIRPMTLSFRLAANMTAGHVIMCLISLFSIKPMMKSFMLIMSMSMMYTLFEMMICIIQTYIFCLLISLYSNDHA